MEKKVTIDEKEYTVKEIPYLDALDFPEEASKKELVLLAFKASIGLSEEDLKGLTSKQGKELELAIAEVNGTELDFQDPTEKKE